MSRALELLSLLENKSIKMRGFTYNKISTKEAENKNNRDLFAEIIKYSNPDKDLDIYWIDDESKLDNVHNKSNHLWVIKKK